MRKLILLLLLSPTLLFADARKYNFADPNLNNELDSIYHDLLYLKSVNIAASSVSFISASISTATIIKLDASTGTIKSFMVIGTATNDDAPLGRIGQYAETTGQSTVNFPASGTLGDVSSLSIPAGDWDISFVIYWGKNGATVTSFQFCVGPNSGNDNTGLQNGINCTTASTATTFSNTVEIETLPTFRVSLNSTTTRYLKLSAAYTVATPQYFGFRMSARRPR